MPAIAQAAQGKEVVISTHTISLQEQLMEKDIPFLRAVAGQEFSAVFVQGAEQLSVHAAAGAGFKKSLTLFPGD